MCLSSPCFPAEDFFLCYLGATCLRQETTTPTQAPTLAPTRIPTSPLRCVWRIDSLRQICRCTRVCLPQPYRRYLRMEVCRWPVTAGTCTPCLFFRGLQPRMTCRAGSRPSLGGRGTLSCRRRTRRPSGRLSLRQLCRGLAWAYLRHKRCDRVKSFFRFPARPSTTTSRCRSVRLARACRRSCSAAWCHILLPQQRRQETGRARNFSCAPMSPSGARLLTVGRRPWCRQ